MWEDVLLHDAAPRSEQSGSREGPILIDECLPCTRSGGVADIEHAVGQHPGQLHRPDEAIMYPLW